MNDDTLTPFAPQNNHNMPPWPIGYLYHFNIIWYHSFGFLFVQVLHKEMTQQVKKYQITFLVNHLVKISLLSMSKDIKKVSYSKYELKM